VSKQRADQLARQAGFPAPVAALNRREGLGEVGRGSVDARSREAQVKYRRVYAHENEDGSTTRHELRPDHDRASKFWRSPFAN